MYNIVILTDFGKKIQFFLVENWSDGQFQRYCTILINLFAFTYFFIAVSCHCNQAMCIISIKIVIYYLKCFNCYLQVLKILAWDVVNHEVFYMGTQDKKPGQQHLYIVKDPLNEDARKWVNLLCFNFHQFIVSNDCDFNFHRTEPKCITCDLADALWSSRFYYVNCTHFDAFFSPSSSIATNYSIDKYILECQGPGLPLAGN